MRRIFLRRYRSHQLCDLLRLLRKRKLRDESFHRDFQLAYRVFSGAFFGCCTANNKWFFHQCRCFNDRLWRTFAVAEFEREKILKGRIDPEKTFFLHILEVQYKNDAFFTEGLRFVVVRKCFRGGCFYYGKNCFYDCN